ncbi:MAG: hypothetical protein N2C14_27850 [Planctomycetales bacterium]
MVQKVDEFTPKQKRLYPNVFRSHKEFRKEITAYRKKLLQEDPKYKETLHAVHRANRALDAFLIGRSPEFESLPPSRRARELEQLRQRFHKADGYLKLVAVRDQAQQELERKYPKLFKTDDEINQFKKDQRKALQQDADFKAMLRETSDAYRAQQAYLLEHDPKLAKLTKLIEAEKR